MYEFEQVRILVLNLWTIWRSLQRSKAGVIEKSLNFNYGMEFAHWFWLGIDFLQIIMSKVVLLGITWRFKVKTGSNVKWYSQYVTHMSRDARRFSTYSQRFLKIFFLKSTHSEKNKTVSIIKISPTILILWPIT